MSNKIQHYINRFRYNRTHTMLPEIGSAGGGGGGGHVGKTF
jgi:hypothetical protein